MGWEMGNKGITKQEKIREGIAKLLSIFDGHGETWWEKKGDKAWRDKYLFRADGLMKYEDSQGVVLKVEGKWISQGQRMDSIDVHTMDGIEKYVATEPLIKEVRE